VFPYLDLPGFVARSVMPATDVALVEAKYPGYTAQRIAVRSSLVNARLRKRYGNAANIGNSLPLGQAPPELLAEGTAPPPVGLSGRPVLGCLEMALAMLAPGPLGTSTFQWSSDGGSTWHIGAAAIPEGTAPPAVTFSGPSTLAIPSDLVVAVVLGGPLGTARFQYSTDGGLTFTIASALAPQGLAPPPVTVSGLSSLAIPSDLVVQVTQAGGLGLSLLQYSLDGGMTWVTGVPTGPAVPLGASGLVASFPAALYATDNVYTGQGIPTAPTAPLGASGLVAAFPAATYHADNVYTAQGIPTAPLVPLAGTGLSAVFPVGTYGADNIYSAAPPVPETVLGWIVAMVTVDVYQKRGVNPQDPMILQCVAAMDGALAELKEAADSKDGLFDLPACEDTDSAVTTGGPLGYTETSPYVWTDQERRAGRGEDGSGRGTGP
jgi:hypothetical protein